LKFLFAPRLAAQQRAFLAFVQVDDFLPCIVAGAAGRRRAAVR
jgi:hypothetical protein